MGVPQPKTLAALSQLAPPSLLPASPPVHQALVVFTDLAIRSAMFLPVRVDFMEVLRLLHKDELFVRWFTQLHCRLPSALH